MNPSHDLQALIQGHTVRSLIVEYSKLDNNCLTEFEKRLYCASPAKMENAIAEASALMLFEHDLEEQGLAYSIQVDIGQQSRDGLTDFATEIRYRSGLHEVSTVPIRTQRPRSCQLLDK